MFSTPGMCAADNQIDLVILLHKSDRLVPICVIQDTAVVLSIRALILNVYSLNGPERVVKQLNIAMLNREWPDLGTFQHMFKGQQYQLESQREIVS